jgi:hypothetical protein
MNVFENPFVEITYLPISMSLYKTIHMAFERNLFSDTISIIVSDYPSAVEFQFTKLSHPECIV